MAVAILLLGLGLALMAAQPSIDRALSDLKSARESASAEMLGIKGTEIGIASAVFNNTTSVLNITVKNSGSEVLPLSGLDILLNGTYVSGGFGSTGYIYPGQSREVSLTNVTDPRSIKIVGPWGVSCMTTSVGRG